jgi:HB1, ASXL, restriction endonuclease HTH domain
MTFLEAALNILGREKRPLHFKDLTERAMTKKLLTFVGRTPEVTMQTQLTAAVKKAPGNPFVRVKPGVFGLLRYPELPPEEPEAPAAKNDARTDARSDARNVIKSDGKSEGAEKAAKTDAREPAGEGAGRGRRR